MSGSWAAGWATNDIVTAAEFRKGAGAIFDTTLGASAGSIDTGAVLPTTYSALWVVVYLRGDAVADQVNAVVRFNGDTGANYLYENQIALGAAVSTSASSGQTSGMFGAVPGGSAAGLTFGAGDMLIPQYGQGTNQKTYRALLGSITGTNSSANTVTGRWATGAAINRVTVLPTTGNFVAGSRVTIYALGA